MDFELFELVIQVLIMVFVAVIALLLGVLIYRGETKSLAGPSHRRVWVYPQTLKMHKRPQCKKGSEIEVIVEVHNLSKVNWCKDCIA